jgi:hypothetical protein
MKSIIRFVAQNKFFHLFLGLVTVFAGLNEAWDTISQDFSTGNFHSAHGVVAIGVWHLCRSISELVEASDYLDKGV